STRARTARPPPRSTTGAPPSTSTASAPTSSTPRRRSCGSGSGRGRCCRACGSGPTAPRAARPRTTSTSTSATPSPSPARRRARNPMPEKYDVPDPLHAPGPKGRCKREAPPAVLRMEAVGLEAEFGLVVDGREAKPEAVFGTPRAFLPGPLLHRTGRSYALPGGGAVYFDTGVVEVATPAVEVERGCAARAGRNLWEAIHRVRDGLDGWERRTGRDARLVGFSTHYNVSFRRPE